MVRVQFQPRGNRRLSMNLPRFMVRVPFQPHRNWRLAMTVWGVLSMTLVGFKVRAPFQPHQNNRLAMPSNRHCERSEAIHEPITAWWRIGRPAPRRSAWIATGLTALSMNRIRLARSHHKSGRDTPPSLGEGGLGGCERSESPHRQCIPPEWTNLQAPTRGSPRACGASHEIAPVHGPCAVPATPELAARDDGVGSPLHDPRWVQGPCAVPAAPEQLTCDDALDSAAVGLSSGHFAVGGERPSVTSTVVFESNARRFLAPV